MMKRGLVLIVLPILILGTNATADDFWTPEKSFLIKNISSVDISPDGKYIAYAVREWVIEEAKSESITHIWLSAVDGSRTFQLTRGEKGCFSPAWSLDGKWIAFLSSRSGKNNLWLIRPDGGEARRLTDVKTGVGSFKWSPDGKEIAFLMGDPPKEEDLKKSKSKDDARVVGASFSHSHLYRVKAELCGNGFAEPVRVTEGEFSIREFDWSPDSKTFVYSHIVTPRAQDANTQEISLIPVEGGEITPLVRSKGVDRSPLFSPDGKTVSFISACGDETMGGDSWLCLVPTGGGETKVLYETYECRQIFYAWSPDGSGLYYTEPEGTNMYTYFLPVDGSPYRLVSTQPGNWFDANFSKDCSFMAFTYENFEVAKELCVLEFGESEFRRITNVNGHLPDLPIARSEVITWPSFDGLEIEGVLTYPLDYQEGQRYPLLVMIHGGPAGAFIRNFTANADFYPIQTFAAKGFVVLRPNPRGSAGRGSKFRLANLSDWGGGDYQDIVTGVDYLIDKGIADPERMGVMGWSYGGYMTSWIITQTDKFKAAAVGAGVTNLISFANTTDIVGFIPSYFEGELWERADAYRERSAMFHIGNVKTPTLIVHGERDTRVPIQQAYELYNALKRKGVETMMVAYPRTGHGPREPKLMLDLMNRHLEWFSTHLLK